MPIRCFPWLLLCCLTTSHAGTTEYRGDVDAVDSSSPSGAADSGQVLIEEADRFGNQRTLRIGHPGGTITRSRPCTIAEPGPTMNCTGQDLRGVQWKDLDLSGGQFDGADLRGASLRGSRLQDASFNDAQLDGADLSGADLSNCAFNNAHLRGTRLKAARLNSALFMDADLDGADLTGATLVDTEFMAARMDDATWIDGRRCAAGSVGECLH